MSETLRAFFAVEPDEAARRAAGRVRDVLRRRPHGDGVHWVRDESLHVTLRFLGQVAREAVAPLVEHVEARLEDEPSFELTLGGLGAFPSGRRARVVWLALEPAAPAERLARAVERGVTDAGFAPEERPFRAHLTLGRVRRARRAPRLDDPPAAEAQPFSVREVVLFQSRLHRDGARYTPLERLSLRADPLTP
ncbi:MAG: RNA 2',3'-cyclic phosphodiesterase [Myxococcota bacterium]